MENRPIPNLSKPTGEEFPIKELEELSDWNARAWAKIQARDAKAVSNQSLGAYLSKSPLGSLDAMFMVLNHDKQDIDLQDAIAAEIECRIDGADTNAPTHSNLA